jgi:hypothetical protein
MVAFLKLTGRLATGEHAIVDDDVLESVRQYKWHLTAKGYAKRGNRGFLHRVVWELKHGSAPSGFLDHINRNKLDCRLENLRIATRTQNEWNKGIVKSRVGFLGVGKHHNRFRARATINGKSIHCGTFSSAIEAAMRYDEVVLSAHGEFACTNADLGLL